MDDAVLIPFSSNQWSPREKDKIIGIISADFKYDSTAILPEVRKISEPRFGGASNDEQYDISGNCFDMIGTSG
jgi:hypothetical protein